jgi:flagellar basal-body rod protein FlgF
MREMEVVANNLANASTTGFRAEGVVFAEHVRAAGDGPSLSMARAHARAPDLSQGSLERTGGTFDLAIRGAGFFQVETPEGPRLTRAGAFTPDAAGELVNPDGHRLLDAGGAPIFVPPDAAGVAVAPDGTVSADGRAVGRIGLWQPEDPVTLRHEAGTLFAAAALVPAEAPGAVVQGMLEGSNVDPMGQIARMIEVQRSYELGQTLLDREDERLRGVIQTLTR